MWRMANKETSACRGVDKLRNESADVKQALDGKVTIIVWGVIILRLALDFIIN